MSELRLLIEPVAGRLVIVFAQVLTRRTAASERALATD